MYPTQPCHWAVAGVGGLVATPLRRQGGLPPGGVGLWLALLANQLLGHAGLGQWVCLVGVLID